MTDDLVERVLSVEVVLWLTSLAIGIAVVSYVIDRVRGRPAQHEPKASELLSKFRDLHSRGELADEEFRTIRTVLAAQLEEELKDKGEKGCDD